MLTRYPERFGALFCTIPLIDMRRYTKLLAGASWIAEYGDPDKPEEWAWLQTYSAYHQAVPGRPYPPILIATTRARRPRASRPRPQDGGQAAGDGLRRASFYEPPPAATATARTTGSARAFIGAGLRLPAAEDRLHKLADQPLCHQDVGSAGPVDVGQHTHDPVAVPAVEGEGVAARRCLIAGQHVGHSRPSSRRRSEKSVRRCERELPAALPSAAPAPRRG